MASVPQRVQRRILAGTKDFLKVLTNARSLDVNESDTVKIIYDMLHAIFGYEKYVDITSEVAIRGTYCDLAIKHAGKVRYLIECKSIGTELKDSHLKQVIDYAANEGIDWVILTNAISWLVYKVEFSKPIDKTHLVTIDFLSDNFRNADILQRVFLLSKEAIKASAIETFVEERKATDKYAVSAILCSDDMIGAMRRAIRSKYRGVTIDKSAISGLLLNEIIKREIVDSDQFKDACKSHRRAISRRQKSQAEPEQGQPPSSSDPPAVSVAPKEQ